MSAFRSAVGCKLLCTRMYDHTISFKVKVRKSCVGHVSPRTLWRSHLNLDVWCSSSSRRRTQQNIVWTIVLYLLCVFSNCCQIVLCAIRTSVISFSTLCRSARLGSARRASASFWRQSGLEWATLTLSTDWGARRPLDTAFGDTNALPPAVYSKRAPPMYRDRHTNGIMTAMT